MPALLIAVARPVLAGQNTRRPEIAEDVIVVHSGSGEELHGRLLELSAATLAILVEGRRIEVPMDDVLRIDTRHDSVKDGAIIGGAVGGGLVALACAGFEGGASECATATVFYAGFGALIGAGIDALHKGRTPIYIKAGKSSSSLQVKIRW